MKSRFVLSLTLALFLAACSGSTDASENGAEGGPSASPKGTSSSILSPEEVPEDEEGLKEAYSDLFAQIVETMEGIETKTDLDKGLSHISKMGPTFQKIMDRSEELGFSVDEGAFGEKVSALADRMQTAMKGVVQKFPTEAMRIMNAMTDVTGGVGGR